jgi:hypothetical protein
LNAHAAWHSGHELSEGAFGCCDEARIAEGAGLGHEKRAQFGFVEAGDFCAPTFFKLPTAVDAAQGKDGNTCGAESFHIAVGSALRYLQTLG